MKIEKQHKVDGIMKNGKMLDLVQYSRIICLSLTTKMDNGKIQNKTIWPTKRSTFSSLLTLWPSYI